MVRILTLSKSKGSQFIIILGHVNMCSSYKKNKIKLTCVLVREKRLILLIFTWWGSIITLSRSSSHHPPLTLYN